MITPSRQRMQLPLGPHLISRAIRLPGLLVLALVILGTSSCGTPTLISASPDKLHQVAGSGNVVALNKAIVSGTNIDQVDGFGKTPLFYAVAGRRSPVVADLLQHGADPNHIADDGNSPLHVAAETGDVDIVELLLRSGARPNSLSEQGITPLMLAARANQPEVARKLLAAGARAQALSDHGDSALSFAVRADGNSSTMVRLLVKARAPIDHPNKQGMTPLLDLMNKHGFGSTDESSVRLLVDGHADVNRAIHGFGLTPLMLAARAGSYAAAKYLLAVGARIDSKDSFGKRALYYAINAADEKLVGLLLKNGADAGVADNSGLTPLMAAVMSSDAAVIKRLIKAGADTQASNRQGYSVLLLSIAAGVDPSLLDLLIDHGANPNGSATDGLSPLALACQTRQKALAVRLYARGAKPDFDSATIEGISMDAFLHEAMAGHFLDIKRYREAGDACDIAQKQYLRLAELYREWARNQRTRVATEKVATSVLDLLMFVGETLVHARENARSNRMMTQAKAMRHADKAGTGFVGYTRYLDSHPNASAVYRPYEFTKIMDSANANRAEDEISSTEIAAEHSKSHADLLHFQCSCIRTSSGAKSLDDCRNVVETGRKTKVSPGRTSSIQ